MDSYFIVTAPGLEPFTQEELRGLVPAGYPPFPATETGPHISPSPGGIEYRGDLAALYRLNLHLRTATRVLARLGNFFYAKTFPELKERATHLPWERYLIPGKPVALRVTCHKSKLYHSDAVARTVVAAIAERLGKPSPVIMANDESEEPAQLIVIRLVDDRCTVSIDSSGRLLHKRGYRKAVAKAPLRETLAAALLMASGWDKISPLIDPFCGSGTIPIEASLMALGIPPGVNRHFAFMDWPNYDEALWLEIARNWKKVENSPPLILASDRDAGAIKMSRANAERAGVEDAIEFKCQAVSAISPPPQTGWIVTNPPYGLRISEGRDLRNLYAQFGNVLQVKCPGWHVSALCNDLVLLGQMRLGFDTGLGFINGGIAVRVANGMVPMG